jgi:hypothetical protein
VLRKGREGSSPSQRTNVLVTNSNRTSQEDPVTGLERSPSPVYGAALLMRLGNHPLAGPNPALSALLTAIFDSVSRPGRRQEHATVNEENRLFFPAANQ